MALEYMYKVLARYHSPTVTGTYITCPITGSLQQQRETNHACQTHNATSALNYAADELMLQRQTHAACCLLDTDPIAA